MLENNLPTFQKNITVAITGHRILGENYKRSTLLYDLNRLYKKGFRYFLIGMAVGFDSECCKALMIMREGLPDIKVVAVIPCLDQALTFSMKESDEYKIMLENVDYKVVLQEKYSKNCMLLRNNFMVENSSLTYAYYNDTNKGGTFYTINQTIKEGHPVFYYGKYGRQ